MSRDEIASAVRALTDPIEIVRAASPADNDHIYTGLGLRLTYQLSKRPVRTDVHISPAQHWQFESVREASRRLPTCLQSLVSLP